MSEPIEGVSIPLGVVREFSEACADVDDARREHTVATEALSSAQRRFELARGRKILAVEALERAATEARAA